MPKVIAPKIITMQKLPQETNEKLTRALFEHFIPKTKNILDTMKKLEEVSIEIEKTDGMIVMSIGELISSLKQRVEDFEKNNEDESFGFPLTIPPGASREEIFACTPEKGLHSPIREQKRQEEEDRKVKLANEITNHFFDLGARVGYSDFQYVKERL